MRCRVLLGLLSLVATAEAVAAAKAVFDCPAETVRLVAGARIFVDRDYCVQSLPYAVRVREWKFVRLPIDGWSCTVKVGGEIFVLTPAAVEAGGARGSATQDAQLSALGFVPVGEIGSFQLFDGDLNRVRAWRKVVRKGDRIVLSKWAVPVGLETPMPTEDVIEPVNVDIGRQMFLNERLIRDCTARRVWHHPVKYGGNPVLRPETKLEKGNGKHTNAMAAPFSGGVWYDGRDDLYKCFYHAGWAQGEAYATSKDGLVWERPDLDGRGGNLVFETKWFADSSAVILDPDARDGFRWKAFNFEYGDNGGRARVSKDGLVWSAPVRMPEVGDRSTIFYNPFTKLWGFSLRCGAAGYGRARRYSEHRDFLTGAKTLPNARDWVRNAAGGRNANGEELYNFDCVAYESVLIGLAMVMNQPQNSYWSLKGLPKLTDLRFGFNADPMKWDGWEFPETEELDGYFIPQTRQYGTWDMGYLQSNAAICLVVGDELRFYYSGFAGDVKKANPLQTNIESGMYANASMGFAVLRRDGFCSMEEGALVTKRLVFSKGDRLWLNLDAKKGSVDVKATAADGKTLGRATYSSVDATRLQAFALPARRPFALSFKMTGGAKLYSFWTSDAKGRSGGYLAGGSPESKTLRDVE